MCSVFKVIILFHYRFVTSLLCSRPRLSLPLFVTSLYYLFKVCIVLLSVCYVVSSRFRLYLHLFVTSLCFLLMVSFVSLSVCYVTILSLQGMLRHHGFS